MKSQQRGVPPTAGNYTLPRALAEEKQQHAPALLTLGVEGGWCRAPWHSTYITHATTQSRVPEKLKAKTPSHGKHTPDLHTTPPLHSA